MINQSVVTQKVGRMVRVDLREIWNNEASDFTPWIAKNIGMLGDAIGVQMEAQSQETPVGVFRADIVARDVQTDGIVLIENQLEKTDHNHLGQIITYASGLQALTVIWVAAHFCDEHRAALDWLNEINTSDVRFYGLEIELWNIGESETAAKFNVVCRPNSWKRLFSDGAGRQIGIPVDDVLALIEADPSLLNLSGAALAQKVGTSKSTANRAKSLNRLSGGKK